MASRAMLLAGSVVYGFLLFGGTAVLGFVVLPAVGYAAGLYPIDTEARAAFSLVTLKAVPFLVGQSAAAAVFHEPLVRFSVARRIAVYFGTVLLIWSAGAAVAVFVLG